MYAVKFYSGCCGPLAVEKYCKDAGINDISIKINEEQQQANWDLQFQNWTTPKAANTILELSTYSISTLTNFFKAYLKLTIPNNKTHFCKWVLFNIDFNDLNNIHTGGSGIADFVISVPPISFGSGQAHISTA